MKTWVFTVGNWDDVGAEHHLGDVDAVFVDVVEHEHLGLGHIPHPLHLGLVEDDVWDVKAVFYRGVLVLDAAFDRVDDDSAVVGRGKVIEAVGTKLVCHAFDLPWRGGTRRVVVLPRDVYFE